LAPQDEVCRCLWWCTAAAIAASSVFDVAGGTDRCGMAVVTGNRTKEKITTQKEMEKQGIEPWTASMLKRSHTTIFYIGTLAKKGGFYLL